MSVMEPERCCVNMSALIHMEDIIVTVGMATDSWTMDRIVLVMILL